jgi:hypothetical protein
MLGLAVFLLACVVSSCGKKSTEPSTDNPPSNPTGVLLQGDPDSLAVSATVPIPNVHPEPYQVLSADGLLANRLFVVLSPAAKIGSVNALLDSLGARIISMSSASLFLTLSMPAVADSSEAAAVCERLRTSGAFLFAFPTHEVQPPPDEAETALLATSVPGEPALSNMSHLTMCGMPAAWNTKGHAARLGHKVTLLVPDSYVQLQRSSEIPAQVFATYPGDGPDPLIVNGQAMGNHGFHVCGIIGAAYDDIGSTGLHPGPTSLLEIRSLNVAGEEWGRQLQLIKNAMPATGSLVINTSRGYNDPFFSRVSKWQRVMLALNWRELVGESQADFLHITSAGNEARRTSGEGSLAVFNSPFTMAAQMHSPWDWVGQGEYTEADSLAYATLEAYYMTSKPWVLQPLTNVIVVGSSTGTGARSAFSNLGADVRMKGEVVFGPCIQSDANCDNQFASLTGTSQAAPQVAGLAAYLINLQPSLTVTALRRILVDAYDNSVGFVNAYRAVLALDIGLDDARIRTAILDVAGTTDAPGSNSAFDEHDIAVYLAEFAGTATRDHSRYDLNGDGFTGGMGTAVFDLTADVLVAYTSVSDTLCDSDTTYDESHLTDLAILKYYAYSPLYSGDPDVRDGLFGCGILFTFDQDLDGWSTGVASTGLFNSVLWQSRDGGIVKLDGSDGGTSDGQPNSWMFRSIDLPADVTTLRFDTSPHNRAGATGALRVRLHDGATFHTLLNWEVLTGIEGQLLWTSRQADIAAYAGQTVTIYFEQGDNDIGVNEQRYIDNVSIF